MVLFLFSAVKGGAPVNMSYIRAPRDHQSTAFPWPVLDTVNVSISQVLYFVYVTPGQNLWRHVLDGATEGVGDGALVYRLFAQPEVCQLDVALSVQQDVFRL